MKGLGAGEKNQSLSRENIVNNGGNSGREKFEAVRGLSAVNTELKSIKRPLYFKNNDVAPLIKRVPDSGISHKSRK